MAAVDLEELEQKARAATPGEWWMSVEDGSICAGEEGPDAVEVGAIDLGTADTEHVLANSPLVTLALIARIRELEAFIRETPDAALQADKMRREDWPKLFGPEDGEAMYMDDGKERLLARGMVLP